MVDWVTPVHVAGGVAGAVLAVWALISKVWPWVKKVWHKMFNAAHDIINARLDTLVDSMDWLVKEIKPHNGEGSIRDSMNRMEAKQDSIEQKQDFLGSYMKASLHAHDKAIFETDKSGQLIYVNKFFCRQSGFTEREIMGEGWINMIHEPERKEVLRKWLAAVAGQRDFDEHLTYSTPKGAPYPVHAIARVIKDDKGEAMGHMGEIIKLGEPT